MGLDADAAAKKAWILDIRTAAPRANASPIERRAVPRQSDIDAQTPACAACRARRVPEAPAEGGIHSIPAPSAVCETTKEPRQYSRNAHRAAQSVKHLPERLSRRNRNRVVKLSNSYRNPKVKHVPELHNEQTEPELRRSVDGFDRLVLLGQVFALVSMAEDAGFEPARACTQPAFQLSTGPFGTVRRGVLSVDFRGSGCSRTSANDDN